MTLNVFGPSGEPVRMWRIPTSAGVYGRVAFDGSRAVLAGEDGLWLFSDSQAPQRLIVNLSMSKRTSYRPFLVKKGSELWLVQRGTSQPEMMKEKRRPGD